MPESTLEGLALSCRPFGESDRILTLLTAAEGLVRLVVPGGRRPTSSLAAALPLSLLRLQAGGRGDLRRVRQLQVLRSHGGLGGRLETLAAAQGLAELALILVPEGSTAPDVLALLLLLLERLEAVVRHEGARPEALAIAVQGGLQLLALGGFALPLARCALTGVPLQPPIGDRAWRCSLLPQEGLALGAVPGAHLLLTASELALLQRLPRRASPRRRDGGLLGPEPVWLHLLDLLEAWSGTHLGRSPRAFRLLRVLPARSGRQA